MKLTMSKEVAKQNLNQFYLFKEKPENRTLYLRGDRIYVVGCRSKKQVLFFDNLVLRIRDFCINLLSYFGPCSPFIYVSPILKLSEKNCPSNRVIALLKRSISAIEEKMVMPLYVELTLSESEKEFNVEITDTVLKTSSEEEERYESYECGEEVRIHIPKDAHATLDKIILLKNEKFPKIWVED